MVNTGEKEPTRHGRQPNPSALLLRGHRRRHRLTQEALAAASGIAVRTIRDIESGRARPRPSTLALLGDALGLTGGDREAFLGDPSSPHPVIPCELPLAVTGYTGPAARLRSLLCAARTGAAAVFAHGPAGSGTTTTAVHAAHRLAFEYPDGQIFLSRGELAAPSCEVLARVLRSFGVPDWRIPATTAERAARYRSELAHRRTLVLADGLDDAELLDRLLPGTPGSLLLATGRRAPALAGVATVELAAPLFGGGPLTAAFPART